MSVSAALAWIVFVAFVVWLGYRIIKKRDLWAMRTAEVLVAIFLGLILLALLLPVVESARPYRPRRVNCSLNLQHIGLALHQYHIEYGSFPPAYIADKNGRPIHSWRTLILPYMDLSPQYSRSHLELYNRYRFDEPWNGPHNAALSRESQWEFYCYSDF